MNTNHRILPSDKAYGWDQRTFRLAQVTLLRQSTLGLFNMLALCPHKPPDNIKDGLYTGTRRTVS